MTAGQLAATKLILLQFLENEDFGQAFQDLDDIFCKGDE